MIIFIIHNYNHNNLYAQHGRTIKIITSTPSATTTDESTTKTSTLSTTTIQPNTEPELCKVNFLPAHRGPLGFLTTPFKICTRKLLKKVPFQKCGRNDCGGGVRLIFMQIVSISKIVK